MKAIPINFTYIQILVWIIFPIVVAAIEINKEGDPWYLFATIAPISGVVGWFTNVVALKMTFYPVEFFGIPFILIKEQPFGLFGWQGIIPSKSGKMAGIAVDLMVGKLIDVKKVFQRLDPHRMAEVLRPGMRESMKRVVDNAAEREMPIVWKEMPDYMKEQMYETILKTVPEFFQSLLEDVQDNIFDVFDIRDFAVRKMTMDKNLTNNIFLKCGAKEFKFIEHSGFLFGFIFGLIQTVIVLFWNNDIIMPVGGFIVGFATNWLALKMIFEPIEPIYIGKFKIHGLFLRRQAEVAVEFAHMSAAHIFTSEQMWNEILYGPKASKFDEYVRKHSKKTSEALVRGMDDVLKLHLTEHGFRCTQDRIADDVIRGIPETIHLGYQYSEQALDIESEIREKLLDLPSADFEGVLHPVFQEDEIKLILVGALLGLAVGFFQLYVIFGTDDSNKE